MSQDPASTQSGPLAYGRVFSTAFPEGHGDLVVRSSDGTYFHVQRFFLAYVSPVLKQQLDQLTDDYLQLTEEATTLECLFTCIDLSKLKPSFTNQFPLLVETIKAARKYQMHTSTTQLRKELLEKRDLDGNSFTMSYPIESIAVSLECGFAEEARSAMWALAVGDVTTILGNYDGPNVSIPAHVLREIFQHRRRNTVRLVEMTKKVNDMVCCRTAQAQSRLGEDGWKIVAVALIMPKFYGVGTIYTVIKEMEGVTCPACGKPLLPRSFVEEIEREGKAMEAVWPIYQTFEIPKSCTKNSQCDVNIQFHPIFFKNIE